jgi:GT2 family glycosyltransferase
MSLDRATVVVVTYTARDYFWRCLESLRPTAANGARIIVVDNGSADRHVDAIRSRFPEYDAIRVETNSGFISGANAGIREAVADGAEFVALAVLPEEPGYAIKSRLNGFALVFTRDLIGRVGLYDPTYQIYADEDDHQVRARIAGFRMLRVDTPIVHIGSATLTRVSEEAGYLQMRNSLRLAVKHGGPVRMARVLGRIVSVACLPVPLGYDPGNAYHFRFNGDRGAVVNMRLLGRAIGWNVRHVAETRAVARAERSHMSAAAQNNSSFKHLIHV